MGNPFFSLLREWATEEKEAARLGTPRLASLNGCEEDGKEAGKLCFPLSLVRFASDLLDTTVTVVAPPLAVGLASMSGRTRARRLEFHLWRHARWLPFRAPLVAFAFACGRASACC